MLSLFIWIMVNGICKPRVQLEFSLESQQATCLFSLPWCISLFSVAVAKSPSLGLVT